jgi:hypothetical protein
MVMFSVRHVIYITFQNGKLKIAENRCFAKDFSTCPRGHLSTLGISNLIDYRCCEPIRGIHDTHSNT